MNIINSGLILLIASSLQINLAKAAELDRPALQPGFKNVITNDEELTSPELVIRQSIPLDLVADEVRVVDKNQENLSVDLLREEHGQLTSVEGINFNKDNIKCSNQESTVLTLELQTNYYAVTNGQGTYRIKNEIPCHGSIQLIFKSDSFGGQALGIWQVAYSAQTKLAQAVGLNFWNQKVNFVWPDEADYYSWGTVHISRGDHWDVVGHELGHAIYDLGNLGAFGGGQHKIDECYSEALALSEGWASFFSAWLRVNPNDADAKFEFIVPRRAPIRFETIPADVCAGSSNEWRVTGFFWDLYDQNQDQEDVAENFAKLWNPLLNTQVNNSEEALDKLKQSGLSSDKLDQIWKQNFIK